MVPEAIRGAITSEDVLGKDVIDSKGVFLGVSDKIYLDPRSMQFIGISIDKGFLQKGFIISTQYVESIAEHAIFLNMQPATLLRGKVVLGRNGAKIGKIAGVELVQGTNKLIAVQIRTGFLRKIRVPAQFIKSTQSNVFLNITKQELNALSSKEKSPKRR